MEKKYKILVRADQYTAAFFRSDKLGRYRKFWFCGNTGVAMDVVKLLEKLGHKVEVIYN